MIKERNIALCILYSIITCGIYGIYWFITLTDDTNFVAPETETASGGMAFLYSLITCGIYYYYWSYKLGDKLDTVNISKGNSTKNYAVLFLILSLLGFGIINYCIAQSELNKLSYEV